MDVAFGPFGAPVLWYFNGVWHSELMAIGEPSEMHWYVMICDGMVGVTLVAAACLPVIMLIRRRTRTA
jgi:ureidoglycolate hydrolase